VSLETWALMRKNTDAGALEPEPDAKTADDARETPL
jgi:hypothetical protein